MYQPTLGRFLSRDPLSANGVDVLTDTGFYAERLAAMRANPWYYGGNCEHPYVYARNNPLQYADPKGLGTTLKSDKCVIELWCVELAGGLGFTTHCGVEISDSKGSEKFHVFNKTCKLYDERPRPITSGPYQRKATFGGTTPADCECIRRFADLINTEAAAGKLPYSAIPGNDACGGSPTCNSNYTAKCLLANCGFAIKWPFLGTPIGWNHRMKQCVEPTLCSRGGCHCYSWKGVDSTWCGGT